MEANAWIILVIITLTVIMTRVLYVIWKSIKPLQNPSQHLSTLIVLGSGGHTAEMLNLLFVLQRDRFTPRFYIAAATDNMSLQKARSFENSFVDKWGDFLAGFVMYSAYTPLLCTFTSFGTLSSCLYVYTMFLGVSLILFMVLDKGGDPGGSNELLEEHQTLVLSAERQSTVFGHIQPQNCIDPEGGFQRVAGSTLAESRHFLQIYRSREVGQSYITSVGTTLLAITHALWLMVKIRPQVILCNGPGTCIPLCAIAFLFKVFGVRWSSIFYVESIARVKRLSLSGLLLYKLRIADQLFVQWPQLQRKYPRARYVGCLM